MSHRYFCRAQRRSTCRLLKAFNVGFGSWQKSFVFGIIYYGTIEPSGQIEFVTEHPVILVHFSEKAKTGIAPGSWKQLGC